jgi:hypothetical protein
VSPAGPFARWSGDADAKEVEEVPATADGAMWRIREAEHLRDLMSEISDELAGGWLRDWARRDTPA